MALGICSFSGVAYHSGVDLDTPVYKFYPMQRFLEAVNNGEMYFRNILHWEDNWELPTRHFNTDGMSEFDDFFIKKDALFSIFASCFTSCPDSNAMWQIYSPSKESICVETTAKALLTEIAKISKPGLSAYYAPVIYMNIDRSSVNNIFDQELTEEYPAHFYFSFIKRDAFSYERELRLAIRLSPNPREQGVKLPVDISKFVNKVILDPRLTNDELLEQTRKLEPLGIKVEQSSMFTNDILQGKDYEDLIRTAERSSTICGTKFQIFK